MTCIKEGDVVVCIAKGTMNGPRLNQCGIVADVVDDELAFIGHVGYYPAENFTIYAHAPKTDNVVYGRMTTEVAEALKHIKAWNDSHPMTVNIGVEPHPVQEGGTNFVLGTYYDTTSPMEFLKELVDYQVQSREYDLLQQEQVFLDAKLKHVRDTTKIFMTE